VEKKRKSQPLFPRDDSSMKGKGRKWGNLVRKKNWTDNPKVRKNLRERNLSPCGWKGGRILNESPVRLAAHRRQNKEKRKIETSMGTEGAMKSEVSLAGYQQIVGPRGESSRIDGESRKY